MKKLVWIIISFACILWIGFSDSINFYDCTIATMADWAYNFIPLNQYDHILPNDAITKVFEHLRFACCKAGILTNAQCEWYDESAVFPESMYLFDHLLDIYLRRLDAKQEDANWWDLTYWLEPDPLWKEWREFISQIANDSDGTPPTMINEKYRNFWKWSIFFEKYWNDSSLSRKNNNKWLSTMHSKSSNYADWNLADRYYNACNIVMMMYIDIIDPLWVERNWMQYTNASDIQAALISIYDSCENLVHDRIDSERSYTEAIMQQKWSVFLDDTLNAYLNTYFLENNLSSLHDKIFNRWSMFKEVVKSVNKLTKNCS